MSLPADRTNPTRSSSHSRIRRILTVILAGYWTAMFVGTHIPLPDLGHLPQNSDKGMHWIAYTGLSVLVCLWWFDRTGRMRPRDYATMLAVLAAYGAVDELLQIPVHRSADVADFAFDLLGILSGMILFAAGKRWFGRAGTTR